MEELSRHEYKLSPGTPYPLLHCLEHDGLLYLEWEVVASKMRKYYVATDKGGEALVAIRPKATELVGETLVDGPTEANRAQARHKTCQF